MSPLRIVGAFIRRDWGIALSYRVPFVLDLVAMAATLAVFFYISQLVAPGRSPELAQGYFAFVAIGLAVVRLLQVGLMSFALRVRDEQLTGTFETLMATPARQSVVILAEATYAEIWAVIGGVVMLVIAGLFFGLSLNTGLGCIAICVVAVVATVAFLAAVGVAIAAFTVVFKQTTEVVGLIVSGLSLLAGVYFPVAVLPKVLRAVAEALPITWSVHVIRSALLTNHIDALRLAGVVGAVAVGLPLALVLFRRALDRARRDGSLAHY